MQVLTQYFYEMSCFTDSKYSQREGGEERNRGPDNQQELYQANWSQEWHHLSRASRETHKIPAQTHRLRQSGWIRSWGQGKWLTLVDLWPPMMTVTLSGFFFFKSRSIWSSCTCSLPLFSSSSHFKAWSQVNCESITLISECLTKFTLSCFDYVGKRRFMSYHLKKRLLCT